MEWNVCSDLDMEGGWFMEEHAPYLDCTLVVVFWKSGKRETCQCKRVRRSLERRTNIWQVHLHSATLVINVYSTMKVNCMKILIITTQLGM